MPKCISVTLWPDETESRLTLYSPDSTTGAAMLICPGGGYRHLAPHEGEPVAQWLNGLGIIAGVLQYRVAPHQYPLAWNDATRAIRLLRNRAAPDHPDVNRLGILGFSAGGHLAAHLSTHHDPGDANSADPIERLSSRPDLTVLLYPVISMVEPFGHEGSRINLVGTSAADDLRIKVSPERNVTSNTPPAFIFHGWDDPVVPVENSLAYAMALRKAGVGCELHLHEKVGRHGVGLARDNPVASTWPLLCENWLRLHRFI